MNPLVEASWHGAREAAALAAGALPSEKTPVHLSPGRVLATNCVALCDLPSFDSSAMDGWAVAGAGPWAIVGDARAGSPLTQPLAPGTAARIATGSVVPSGTGSVIRWEDARVVEGLVHAEPAPGSDIRRAGEECRAGDLIARVGTTVTPALRLPRRHGSRPGRRREPATHPRPAPRRRTPAIRNTERGTRA